MKDMVSYYKIIDLSSGTYGCQVVCLSFESVFTYIDSLQNELKNRGIESGEVLIDQLLIAGNSQNRFLSIKVNNGIFELTTAKNVSADPLYHQLTSSELRFSKSLLENSILTKSQISLILGGCAI